MKKPAPAKMLHSPGFYPLAVTDCYLKDGNITIKCKSFIKNTFPLLRTFHQGKKEDLEQLKNIGIFQTDDWDDVFNKLFSLVGTLIRAEIREAKNPKYRNITSIEMGDQEVA
jgi:hypothetical protein